VLFHFNPAWLPGGFTGVDVFFVISGYLMTGIIFRGLEQENFSILKFYVARANRIVPALAMLCLVLLVFGWFVLIPTDYALLGKHVGSSLSFISNITYWGESGYFDSVSREKWLLHTWSLSAEWQFYIIYPLVLVAMRKFISLKAMKATVLLSTVLGFMFCVIATYKWSSSSYYLLPTRAWEMLIGGVAYLYPITLQKKIKKRVEWFGLALIVGSYFLISKDNPWPGYLAILPVLGSFLIIQAQRNDSFITSNVIFQKIGAWSYSIYLWHWPLVVAIHYFSLNEVFIYLGIELSVLLGFLSNKYIEKIKFRSDFSNLFSYFKCKPVYMVMVVCIVGSITFKINGIESRSEVSEYSMLEVKERLKPNYGLSKDCEGKFTLSDNCSTSEEPEILVWGDFFAMHIVPAILASNPDVKMIQHTKSTCAPIFDLAPNHIANFAKGCLKFTQDVREWLKSNDSVKYVIVSSPFHTLSLIPTIDRNENLYPAMSKEYKNQFKKTLRELKSYDVKPVIISPPPSTGSNLGKCLNKKTFFGEIISSCDFNYKSITLFQQDLYPWLVSLSTEFDYIDLSQLLCLYGICKSSIDNIFIYRDGEHLSYEGPEFLGRKYNFYDLIVTGKI
jgi:peptidoglycan/LPS O-acetylase OafA/YrhL